jgi:DNA-binding response OmpR family regulator
MRLLIVDDNKNTTTYLTTRFKSNAFAVDSAHDAQTALQMAKLYAYDVIVLDNSMPGTKGKELCKTLRAENIKCPLVMVSGYIDEKEKDALLSTYIDDFMSKPFVFEELLARVRALLRRYRLDQEEVLSIDDLTLNPTTQTASRNGKEIALTQREYAIFSHLMKNANRTVSRQELFREVWETDGAYQNNTVETHILNLRKKIESPNTPEYIITIPSKGYTIRSKK